MNYQQKANESGGAGGEEIKNPQEVDNTRKRIEKKPAKPKKEGCC